jgi:rhodanese-related sulfurtransferase
MTPLNLDPKNEVVVYCDCPNEASAALVARKQQEIKLHGHCHADRGGRRIRTALHQP